MATATVSELSRVNEWILSTLSNDSGIFGKVGQRIYVDQAPQTAISPMVVFSFLGGADKLITGSSRLTQSLYLVRAIAAGLSYDLVDDIADRIEAVLVVPQQGQIVRDVRITSCAREQPHQRKDAENGVPYVYMGGFYRIRFQPASQ